MINLVREGNESSRRMQGKRQLAVLGTCKIELKKEIQLLFQTFEKALKKSSEAMALFPLYSRSRALEANIVQSCFAECLLEEFGENAFYGKYKRLILRRKGYLIFFKKLDGKGYPMNIKTQSIQGILDQNQSIDLFAGTDYNDEPILYFGYQLNRFGQYINPQIVYIDDGDINFSIGAEDIGKAAIIYENVVTPVEILTEVTPGLKNKNVKKAI